MGITVKRLAYGIGAEIIGADLSCAMHKALRDRMPGTYRHMHRTTVAGEPSGALCAGSA